jgi:hypothetical protein
MIVIRTDESGRRTYSVPHQLAEVAQEIFPGSRVDAIFLLARRLVANDLATCERIAERDKDEAVSFARAHLVERIPHRWQ